MSAEEVLKYIIKINTNSYIHMVLPKLLKKVKHTKLLFISEVHKVTEVMPLLKKSSAGELVQKTTIQLFKFHTNCE